MAVQEVNFDSIIGPTHHYGGLAAGNVASLTHRHEDSRPRQAALQGLAKMKLLLDLGFPQAVLPPHPRPHLEFLRSQGFTGTDEAVIVRCARERLDLLSIAYSASAMWAANAATVSPAQDTAEGRVHLTPANLLSTTHRSLEAACTTRLLQMIFKDSARFAVHDPLPADLSHADEGAANHMRLCRRHGDPGVEVFVYGRDAQEMPENVSRRFPARQSRSACELVARRHGLEAARVLFVQQNPEVIDAGVFHNDVIAVANEYVLLCHQRAFVDQQLVLDELRAKLDGQLCCIEIAESELSVDEAVRTYLFNSQLLTRPDGTMLLLCPWECSESDAARQTIDRVIAGENPIEDVRFVDVRQSMRNGGGPACLRLRVVLDDAELAAIHQGVLLTDDLYQDLCGWVERHYRETLHVTDLADPTLRGESATALAELHEILKLELLV